MSGLPISETVTDRMVSAMDAWGDVPDWIVALVNACDATGSSQNKVAKRLGYTACVVSLAIRNQYTGDMSAAETRVRAILIPEQVQCPAIGPISSADCLEWQDKAGALVNSVPHEVRMYRACNRCPRYLKEQDK